MIAIAGGILLAIAALVVFFLFIGLFPAIVRLVFVGLAAVFFIAIVGKALVAG